MSWDCPPGAQGAPSTEKDMLVYKKISEEAARYQNMSVEEWCDIVRRAFREVYPEWYQDEAK